MIRQLKIWILSGILFLPLLKVSAQEEYYESLLKEEVEVENPVYKPVIGVGVGTLNFLGDVKNGNRNPVMGKPAFKFNVSTFVDNKHYFKANFFLIYGTLTGNERSAAELDRNLNFSTDLVTFGINLNYDFRHFLKGDKLIRPFIAVGAENLQFNSKADLFDANGNRYYYWSDGTIRDIAEGTPAISHFLKRDYKYESDLRELNLYGLGNYSQNTFAIPFEAGLDFMVSDRVTMRLATSLHYTFTDLLDNVSSADKTGPVGNKRNDMFNFSYLTLHLDLFSDAKTIIVDKLFADIDFDYTMYGDDDNDLVFDGWDNCPNTPRGVKVDSLGCPLDSDNDGIPDYLDKEPFSSPGAYVNDEGVEITEDQAIAMNDMSEAVPRSEVDKYLLTNIGYSARRGGNLPIPDKFKPLDTNQDGYISFDEVLKAIDDFFDYESALTTHDIYELNDFFFSQ
ncbi:MAG TPA: thrombospondin type 3 repeat-containing protein [Bacteroidales bacterium]|nr:thrombospondin type 3 repeat-containing protein [Bacteroidales bacterium]